MKKMGMLHHVEINVSNLEKSLDFWGWFLNRLGYHIYQQWENGRSYKLDDTYLVFVQTKEKYLQHSYHRSAVGLNHLAFFADSSQQVDEFLVEFKERGVPVLYEDRYPYAGGGKHYALFFEDPDRIKVELVAPSF
jgi:catechol 2,3-dioxygenase-like lactoylglutathione lyase family enzyme